ncbi:MAG: sulfatase [Draconibacterium sp.]
MDKIFSKLFLLFVILALSGQTDAQNKDKPNVLFIVVDDLRPELACYGHSQIKSPNIDKLAEGGLIFDRAYCNIPVCGASRASVLSGIRPNRHRFVNYRLFLDKEVPGVVSLPMHFKNNGYYTASLGKVFHEIADGKGSWSEKPWFPKGSWTGGQYYAMPESVQKAKLNNGNGPVYEAPDGPDTIYPDGVIAEEAIHHLQEFSKTDQPFFLAVGFLKPHLPFNAPKKYWDLYDYNTIKLPAYMKKPKDAPDECMHNFGELRNHYSDIPKVGPLDDASSRKLIQGYYACVSYTDAQVGKVLDELERLGMADNTIVILWGDHGWHLGEHGLWCKHCNFEKVLHAPVIVRAPGKKQNVKTDALVEYVDIYPSLCDLAGLPKPFFLQGKSFEPLMENPGLSWKAEVYCRWVKGETIVTRDHTFTEWFDDDSGEIVARMLYDLNTDREETINISEKSENKELVELLSEKLKKHIATRDQVIIPN